MEQTVWLCWTTTDEARLSGGTEATVAGVYASRDIALADLGQRLLDGEPGLAESRPRLESVPVHGATGPADTAVADVIAAWRGMTGTGRTKVRDRAAGLADALDALAFPLAVDAARALVLAAEDEGVIGS